MNKTVLRTLFPASAFASASLAALLSCAAPAGADSLQNRHPAGCFAAVARDWNTHAPDDLSTFSTFADRFERCAARDKDEVQVRSDLVGWYKSELGITVNYLKDEQPDIAKRHYERCYAVLDRMVTLAQKTGDVALGQFVTESSEHLYAASGAFVHSNEDVGDVPPSMP